MLQECAGVKVGCTRIDSLVNCTWRVCSDSRWQTDLQSDLEMSHWLFNYTVSMQGDIGECQRGHVRTGHWMKQSDQ